MSQTLHYEVIKGDKKIGDMMVKRSHQEGRTYYDVESEVVFKLLFSFTVAYKTASEYHMGQLIKETVHSTLSGKTQHRATVWYDGNDYNLDNGSTVSQFKGPVDYSVTAIYFEEPTNGKPVYSPHFGKYLTFKKTEIGSYELASPDGTNEYFYTHGVCTKVRVIRDFARFSFLLSPESLLAVEANQIEGGRREVD